MEKTKPEVTGDVIDEDLFDTDDMEEYVEEPIIAEVTEYSAIGNVEIEHVSGEVVDSTINADMKSALNFVRKYVDESISELDVQDYDLQLREA